MGWLTTFEANAGSAVELTPEGRKLSPSDTKNDAFTALAASVEATAYCALD